MVAPAPPGAFTVGSRVDAPLADPTPDRWGLTAAAPVYLRGGDADARLRELQAGRAALRPILGEVARVFVGRRLYHAVGYRCLGDWSREKLGLGERTVRGWARVATLLRGLPQLRAAVDAGEVSWTVAGKVGALATPENEAAVLESVRGRTVRAVEAMVRAYRSAEGRAEVEDGGEPEDRVRVSLREEPQVVGMWHAACELARRRAGQQIPVWACAEAIAAEGSTVVGASPDPALPEAARERSGEGAPEDDEEDGRREVAWGRLEWSWRRAAVPPEIEALRQGLDDPRLSPVTMARRLERAVRFRQQAEFELGRILRQVSGRRLYGELGFESFDRYVQERLDLAPRTARRLVRLARAEHKAPEVANGFWEGRLTAMQAEALLRVVTPESASRWVARAREVTLRRLEDDLDAELPRPVDFRAPPGVAAFFLDVVARAGSLEKLLAHVIREWVREGEHWKVHAVIERDCFRCTVPGCRARGDLHRHHIWYKGRGGPRNPHWNQTTLCWFHHQQGEHARRLRIRGRAPDDLVFELAGETYRSGDVKIATA